MAEAEGAGGLVAGAGGAAELDGVHGGAGEAVAAGGAGGGLGELDGGAVDEDFDALRVVRGGVEGDGAGQDRGGQGGEGVEELGGLRGDVIGAAAGLGELTHDLIGVDAVRLAVGEHRAERVLERDADDEEGDLAGARLLRDGEERGVEGLEL